MKRYLARLILPLGLIAVLVAEVSGNFPVPYIDGLERQLYDTRIRLTAPRGVDSNIVIVAVDEQSLEQEGHWPWTREKLALLVDRLFSYGASVVAFDMVFAERDESADVEMLRELADAPGDHAFLERLDQLVPRLDRDRVFAESLTHGPTVLGYYFDTNRRTVLRRGQLPYPAFELSEDMADSVYLPEAFGYGANLEELVASATSAGFISNPLIDEDGIVRRAPLLHRHGLDVYESLALATAATYLNDISLPVFVDTPQILQGYPPLEGLELAGRKIPIDAQGAVLVPYRGPAGSFPYLSATRIMEGTLVNFGLLRDAVAVVGATAPGMMDIRSTPFGSVYPGVEIHANVIAGFLDQGFRWQPAYTVAAETVSLLAFGLLVALVLPVLPPIWSTLMSFALFAIAVGLNFYLWQVKMHVLPLATTLLAISGIYVMNMVFGYFFETRTRSRMDNLFGQYVPPDLVREMSRDPENYSLASDKRELTVMFSDVRDFTRISEKLDAAELSQMMNVYLTTMTRIVHDCKGTIDKYIGDAIMAFWGAPVPDPAHASNAVRAALAMLAALPELNRELEARGMPHVQVGVAVNSGVMSVGNMGSRFRRAYTVMGDSVNLGSRLEGLTKFYGVWLIVSDSTRRAAPEFTYRKIDRVRVKGKEEPVTIFEVLGETTTLPERQVATARDFERFHDHYLEGEWAAAEATLAPYLAENPDSILYNLYGERLREFRANPPGPGWDGVFSHTKK